VITNYKNRAGNLTTNLWEEGKRECSRLLFNNLSLRNPLQTFPIHKEVTIYIKKQVVLLNLGLFPDKLMHIFESKFIKTRESYITFKVRNKRI